MQSSFHFHSHGGCGIQLDDKIVLTGGASSLRRVVAYNSQGLVTPSLPDLLGDRQSHACGHYTDSTGKVVGYLGRIIYI